MLKVDASQIAEVALLQGAARVFAELTSEKFQDDILKQASEPKETA